MTTLAFFSVLIFSVILVGQFEPIKCAAVVQIGQAWPNFRVIAYVDGELVKENSNKATIRVAPVTGDVIDTLDILAKATNFTYTVTVQRDKEYGKKLPNGKWTGMIGALVDDKADIAVAPWIVTPERLQVLSFVEMLRNLTLGILVNPKYGTKNVQYFSDEISTYILKKLDNPKAKAISANLKGGNSSLVENNAEAAKKVLSGKFAYVTDMDSVDEMVSSSHGELAKDSTTIAAPGFSLATYAVKKGSPKTAEVVRQLSAITDAVIKEEHEAKSQG